MSLGFRVSAELKNKLILAHEETRLPIQQIANDALMVALACGDKAAVRRFNTVRRTMLELKKEKKGNGSRSG